MLKKQKFAQELQSKVGLFFSRLPISANQWTLFSLLPAAAGFYLAFLQLPYHSLSLFMLAGAIDALDGAVARAKNQVSDRGAYIDGIVDRLVEFLFVLSFFFYPLPAFFLPAGAFLVAILFFGSTMTSFATAYAEHRHVAGSEKIGRQPGILPRAERLIFLFLALALVPAYPYAASFVLSATALLSFTTFCQRFAYFGS